MVVAPTQASHPRSRPRPYTRRAFGKVLNEDDVSSLCCHKCGLQAGCAAAWLDADTSCLSADATARSTPFPQSEPGIPIHFSLNAKIFFSFCTALGMSHDAPLGWAKLHVRPHAMCAAYFMSMATMCLSLSTLYGIGLPWPMLMIHIPFLFCLSSILCMGGLIWRRGPLVSSGHAFMGALTSFTLSGSFILITPFIGKEIYMPFGSPIVTVPGLAVFMFAGFCAGGFGGAASDHRPEPYESLGPPLTKALFSTLRLMDTVTDFGLVRILLHQVLLVSIVYLYLTALSSLVTVCPETAHQCRT